MIIVVNLICAKYWDLFSWLVYLSLSLALIFFIFIIILINDREIHYTLLRHTKRAFLSFVGNNCRNTRTQRDMTAEMNVIALPNKKCLLIRYTHNVWSSFGPQIYYVSSRFFHSSYSLPPPYND